ncbi:MAG: ABC transporter permease [Methanomassiliicoccaceae archaeon]|nr:ABC transporter permease [Methanomassiliicoccaceae archaeon]
MNHLVNLTKKEIRELLTPQMLISILVMVFIFVGIGSMVGNETSQATSPQEIGIVNGDPGGEWSDLAISSITDFYTSTYGITAEEAASYIVTLDVQLVDDPVIDGNTITNEMQSKGLNTAFEIVPGFSDSINNSIRTQITEYYVFSSAGLLRSASSAVSSTIIPYISTEISLKLVSSITSDEDSAFLLYPIQPSSHLTQYTEIKGTVYSGVTPIELSSTIMSQTLMVPVVMMIIIMMMGSMVISSMGSEKENKTLETLLTMPVKRTTIVSGKLLAAAIVGLIYGLAYMVGMSFYVGGVTGSGSGTVNLSNFGLSIGLTDWIIIAVMIFLAIFCALGLCMILGAFAKNYKSAQTMIMPISVLAIVPMFITMFSSFDALAPTLKVVMFVIPFSHPMMVMHNLMFGDMTLVFAGLGYLVLFALVTIYITVRLYKSDILVTGAGQTKGMKALKSLKGKKV